MPKQVTRSEKYRLNSTRYYVKLYYNDGTHRITEYTHNEGMTIFYISDDWLPMIPLDAELENESQNGSIND